MSPAILAQRAGMTVTVCFLVASAFLAYVEAASAFTFADDDHQTRRRFLQPDQRFCFWERNLSRRPGLETCEIGTRCEEFSWATLWAFWLGRIGHEPELWNDV